MTTTKRVAAAALLGGLAAVALGLAPAVAGTTTGGTRVTSVADAGTEGIRVTTLPDGTRVTTYPDGTRVTEHPDGTRVTANPDGTRVTAYPDGTRVTTNPDGTRVT